MLRRSVKEGSFCTYCRHRAANESLSNVHDHDFYELFWVELGPGVHCIEGKAQTVHPGTLQLIRPEDQHGFHCFPGTPFEFTNVTFFPETVETISRRYFPDEVSYFDVVDWREREFRGLSAYIGDFRAAAAELHAGRRDRLAVERCLLNILGTLRNALQATAPIPGWLVSFRNDLHQQANFGPGIAQMVRKTGRCAEHVSREFRRYYGRTPTEEMNEARLRYAATQLRGTAVKVVDLALELGLENLGYFYRLFAREFGCTPAEYRRAHSA